MKKEPERSGFSLRFHFFNWQNIDEAKGNSDIQKALLICLIAIAAR